MKIPVTLFILLLLTAAIGPHFASYSPDVSVLSDNLQKPSAQHALGTDENGRDILSRLIHGARISLSLSLSVVVLASFLGTLIGFLAAYSGGWVDRLFLMIGDIFQAFPGMLLAIGIAACASIQGDECGGVHALGGARVGNRCGVGGWRAGRTCAATRGEHQNCCATANCCQIF